MSWNAASSTTPEPTDAWIEVTTVGRAELVYKHQSGDQKLFSRLLLNARSLLSSKYRALALQLQECLFVVTGNDAAACSGLQPLYSLGAVEPRRMIARQPPLRDSITPL